MSRFTDWWHRVFSTSAPFEHGSHASYDDVQIQPERMAAIEEIQRRQHDYGNQLTREFLLLEKQRRIDLASAEVNARTRAMRTEATGK